MVSFSKHDKPLFCRRIDCPDAFDFNACLSVFRSVFGADVLIIVFSL